MSSAVLGAAMPTNSTNSTVESAAQTGPAVLAAPNATRASAVDASGAARLRGNKDAMATSVMVATRDGCDLGAGSAEAWESRVLLVVNSTV